MGRRRNFGRQLNGVLLLNKSAGETSNRALQRAKHLFFANKAGHTGALDPLATGVLPVCFGEATKFSQHLLDADKGYISEFKLGVSTDTADADGCVLQMVNAEHISREHCEHSMARFRGDIQQVPPMYSALKKDGQPLYKLARQGIEVERKARNVHIFKYELLDFIAGPAPILKVYIHCSKGTYVRSLAAHLGEILGVGAHVHSLHRKHVHQLDDSDALSLEALEQARGEQLAEVLDQYLLPMDTLVADYPKVQLNDDTSYYFQRGNSVMDTEVYQIAEEGDTVRVFDEAGRFLGLAQITDDSCVAPKRLVVY